MSIIETLKRQETINQSAQIVYENLQQLHRILFGELPPETSKETMIDPSRAGPQDIPYFNSLIHKQVTTDQILNRNYSLLNSILKQLEPEKSKDTAKDNFQPGSLTQVTESELARAIRY